jgi:hypothetical protein
MDQLVKIISEKTGISEEQSRTAVTEVIKYVKGYLPPQVSGYVDTFLDSGTPSSTPASPTPSTPSTSPNAPTNAPGSIDDLVRGVGDMFGSPSGSRSDTDSAPMIGKPPGSGGTSGTSDTTTPGSSGSTHDTRAV